MGASAVGAGALSISYIHVAGLDNVFCLARLTIKMLTFVTDDWCILAVFPFFILFFCAWTKRPAVCTNRVQMEATFLTSLRR